MPPSRIRGTQSLLQIQAQCWGRPGLIARELAWRWLYGVPVLALLWHHGSRIVASLQAANTGIQDISLQQPGAAIQSIHAAWDVVHPQLAALAWLAPLLLAGWAIASGLGRTWVFRALAPAARPRPVAMVLLQLLRAAALAATWSAWFVLVRWAARRDVLHLVAGVAAEPDLVAFAAWLICLSLGSFVVWALWSWLFSIAAILLVEQPCSLPAALAGSLRGRRLIPKLMEVNLVLGIVKIALIVLAMVFSSVPLPFEAQMSGNLLYLWWVFIGVLFLAASDFFQVARLAAFLEFWRHDRSQP